jgi:hypothetical protein
MDDKWSKRTACVVNVSGLPMQLGQVVVANVKASILLAVDCRWKTALVVEVESCPTASIDRVACLSHGRRLTSTRAPSQKMATERISDHKRREVRF